MDKYMQVAKKMLILVDEFDKEDVFDIDKTMSLDKSLRTLSHQAKCIYTDTIMQNYDQILEIMQDTETQNIPTFAEKFSMNGFFYYDEDVDEILDYPLVENDVMIFNLNLTVDRGFTELKSKSIYWGIDYDIEIEDDIHDADALTKDSYYIKSLSRNASISEKSCFRDIDNILDILKDSPNLVHIIKTRFMKPEEYNDTVLNIIAVRIYYLLHILTSLIMYGASTEANKMIDLPIVAIETKYIDSIK